MSNDNYTASAYYSSDQQLSFPFFHFGQCNDRNTLAVMSI